MTGDSVVPSVSAGVAAVDGDSLAICRVFVAKQAGGGYRQTVATYDAAVGSATGVHGGAGVAVINLVAGGNAGYGHGLGGDVGGNATRAAHTVVCGQAVGAVLQGDATDGDVLAVAGVLVNKGAALAGE